jgi:hypothetical protein
LVEQQGRNNAPVLAIKIHQCKIVAKPRPPGVETPGYFIHTKYAGIGIIIRFKGLTGPHNGMGFFVPETNGFVLF